MANENIRKQYEGGVSATVLAGGISAVSTSISVADGSTFPDATNPFVIAIGRGTTSEEKILCNARVTNTLTVLERGYDGTTAQIHAAGDDVEHVLDAHSIDQANQMANTWTAEGDILYRNSAGNPARLPVGAAGTVLRGGGATPAYGEVVLGDLADALVELLCPAGSFKGYIGAVAPTGWKFHNQAIVNCNTLFPYLWAAAPASWKSGTTLTIPDLTDMALVQAGTTVLGATGGANTVTLIEANLPAHVHTIAHVHDMTHGHPGTTASSSSSSSSTVTDPSHAHGDSDAVLAWPGAGGTFGLAAGGQQAYPTNVVTDGSYTGITVATSTTTTTTVSVASYAANTGGSSNANSGSAGSGTAVNIRNKHLAINLIMKAH